MATFKVGQRVKVVGARLPNERRFLGATATITEPLHDLFGPRYTIRLDQPIDGESEWHSSPEVLAPLTDPKADEFIESIKKLKPYEEPKVEPRKPVPVDPSRVRWMGPDDGWVSF